MLILQCCVNQPGSVQDSKVWASGSNILKKPHLYLDEGEFIWVDGGYGHSAITVGPFSHIAADKSQDLQHFNYMLSQAQVQVEHAIAYLKNRFQCLTGYHGNIYHVKDHITAAETIQACIIAHTFASRYDHPADIADLLLPSFSEDEVSQVVQSLQLDASDTQELRRTRHTNQQNTNWILPLQHKECHSMQCQDFEVLLHMIFERKCSRHCSDPLGTMTKTLLHCLDVMRRLLWTTMPLLKRFS
ncbi:uncharacterized protein UDID_18572 [Ustilago sp. UG-2017a]|nr:uncharacterized protein UDID_18572 [Ustilago sp. UG-2017a]